MRRKLRKVFYCYDTVCYICIVVSHLLHFYCYVCNSRISISSDQLVDLLKLEKALFVFKYRSKALPSAFENHFSEVYNDRSTRSVT